MSPSRRTLVVAVGLVVAAILVGIAVEQARPGSAVAASESTASGDSLTLFEPTRNGSALWPYTSRSRSVEGRTLAINVVVHGDPVAVRRALARRTDADWDRTAGEDTRDADVEPVEAVEINGTGVKWRPARGAARYTYVTEPGRSHGEWDRERYQLHVGDYLGSRYHIRAYAPSGGEWTALQAHEEYFDWFRLRHTVTGAASAQAFVERDLRGEPFVAELSRTWTGTRWVSEVQLASVMVVLAFGTSRRERLGHRAADLRERLDPATVALFGATLGIVLAVRFGGVGLERAFPDLSPQVVAGLLYPLLALGLPFVAAVLARWTEPLAGFVAAAAGSSVGFVADFAVLGIDVLPVSVALHRVAAVVVLGMVAVGAASAADGDQGEVGDDRSRWLVAGAVGWLVVLALPLFGLL